jgi:hypothetical protein
MKKINIIKVYDASNIHQAEHLDGRLVLFGKTINEIYTDKMAITHHKSDAKRHKFIAEFEEVNERI